MKFFEDHFTKHHFRHAPHKWLTALVLSPIHHAEMRYKTQYHLKFSHAKKLFVFDMLLLLSTIVLFAAALFWWQYDPTITELVHLDVTANVETERLRSGDDVTLSIEVHNQSDISLISPLLAINVPDGFLITHTSVEHSLDDAGIVIIPLEHLEANNTHTLTLTGQFYGPIGNHESIQTKLIYTQDGKKTPESDIHRLYLTSREPSVSIFADIPTYIVPHVDTNISITLKNEHDHTLPPFDVILQHDQISWTASAPEQGIFSQQTNTWALDSLEPYGSATLEGTVRISPDQHSQTVVWPLSTNISPNSESVVEYEQNISISIAKPNVRISSSWGDAFVTYGGKSLAAIQIENIGNVPLSHPIVSYNGKTYSSEITTLAPGQSAPISILITATKSAIATAQQGPVLLPKATFSASIPSVENYSYKKDIQIVPLPVATTLSITQSSRYYTAEGDQLGRGPLPPTVGKETKYWIFTQLTNTVGSVQDIVFSTTLAPGASWTGKSSVSRGNNLVFNASSRTATWQGRSMNPYETVGLYFEVAVTPGVADIGSTPTLITKSSATAQDPHVDGAVSASFGAVNASLNADTIGKNKGVLVE